MKDEARKRKFAIMVDIKSAAETDDLEELKKFIEGGRSLDEVVGKNLGMTPIHIACIEGSSRFVEYACANAKFDPWLRDGNLRTAFDHAAANGNKRAKDALLTVMYDGQKYVYAGHGFGQSELPTGPN